MTLKHTLKTALVGLKTNKTRSSLTILGVVIGITSIILMMSMGQGAENLILQEIAGFGGEMVAIRPGKEPTGPSDIGDTLFADSLKNRDIDALKRSGNVPDLVAVMPAVVVPGSVSFEGETYRPTIFGGVVEFFSDAFNVYPAEGTLFTESDIKSRASVAVIGVKVKEELFGNRRAVGEYIRIKDRKFRVVGVFGDKGQISLFDFNELVIVPYTTAQTYLLGIDYYNEIITTVKSTDAVPRAVADIERTLRISHGITDPDKDDFYVVTQQGVVDQIQTIIGALTIFLSSVVAVALVVAGVGVMNIMLVSVTERTKEIGLRKAIGATDRDILNQFLLEAIILTGIGGIMGIVFGALISFGISVAIVKYVGLAWVFVFPFSAAVLGLLVSMGVGLVFGIYPARQASKKSPIEALRYE